MVCCSMLLSFPGYRDIRVTGCRCRSRSIGNAFLGRPSHRNSRSRVRREKFYGYVGTGNRIPVGSFRGGVAEIRDWIVVRHRSSETGVGILLHRTHNVTILSDRNCCVVGRYSAVNYHLFGASAWLRMFKFAFVGAYRGNANFFTLLIQSWRGLIYYLIHCRRT